MNTPTKKDIHHQVGVFFWCNDKFETVASWQSRTNVRDQVTEPSAAGGGWSEAKEEKNKEQHEAKSEWGDYIFSR